jgi:hypothetical protein
MALTHCPDRITALMKLSICAIASEVVPLA